MFQWPTYWRSPDRSHFHITVLWVSNNRLLSNFRTETFWEIQSKQQAAGYQFVTDETICPRALHEIDYSMAVRCECFFCDRCSSEADVTERTQSQKMNTEDVTVGLQTEIVQVFIKWTSCQMFLSCPVQKICQHCHHRLCSSSCRSKRPIPMSTPRIDTAAIPMIPHQQVTWPIMHFSCCRLLRRLLCSIHPDTETELITSYQLLINTLLHDFYCYWGKKVFKYNLKSWHVRVYEVMVEKPDVSEQIRIGSSVIM